MRRRSSRAGRGGSSLLALLVLLPRLGCAQAAAAGAQSGTPATDSGPAPYLFALSPLSDGGLAEADRTFLTKLPALIIAELGGLPPRYEDEAYRREVERRAELSARFDKGGELYGKLGEAALARLDPRIAGYSRSSRVESADGAVTAASQALDELLSGAAEETPAPSLPGPAPERQVKLWDGKGRLFDAGQDSPLRAARKQGLDLLVTGSARPLASYLEVRLEGWDSKLGRRVFSWTGYAAPEDPGPLAKDFAGRLETWLAGGTLARVDLSVRPASARLLVDGKALDSAELRLFSPTTRAVGIAAWAPGYREEDRTLLLVPGESRGLVLDLSPQSYGEASLALSPPEARLQVGGREAKGGEPLELGGARDIFIASSPGYESAMAVLPPSGKPSLSLSLRPSDGLGPGKRAELAKDQFYLGLGLLAIGVPLASLAQGYQGMYLEANYRQQLAGASPSFTDQENWATAGYWAAVAGTAGAAVYTITKLIALLGSLD